MLSQKMKSKNQPPKLFSKAMHISTSQTVQLSGVQLSGNVGTQLGQSMKLCIHLVAKANSTATEFIDL